MGTHHTLINGTSYAIKGGTDLIAGTSYQIGGGRTLVNGTAFDIAFDDGTALIWYLNTTIAIPKKEIYGNFSSKNRNFVGIKANKSGEKLIYDGAPASLVYYGSSGWTNQEWRIIIFAEAPEGEMLAWLKTNGKPQ